mmetsp:Transcript_38319/g.96400  ORF Transcript_38319/g.96400 Transcript_38319/m.96400 type:complete len:386 (+) Transcript_38319:1004-2161(+)
MNLLSVEHVIVAHLQELLNTIEGASPAIRNQTKRTLETTDRRMIDRSQDRHRTSKVAHQGTTFHHSNPAFDHFSTFLLIGSAQHLGADKARELIQTLHVACANKAVTFAVQPRTLDELLTRQVAQNLELDGGHLLGDVTWPHLQEISLTKGAQSACTSAALLGRDLGGHTAETALAPPPAVLETTLVVGDEGDALRPGLRVQLHAQVEETAHGGRLCAQDLVEMRHQRRRVLEHLHVGPLEPACQQVDERGVLLPHASDRVALVEEPVHAVALRRLRAAAAPALKHALAELLRAPVERVAEQEAVDRREVLHHVRIVGEVAHREERHRESGQRGSTTAQRVLLLALVAAARLEHGQYAVHKELEHLLQCAPALPARSPLPTEPAR